MTIKENIIDVKKDLPDDVTLICVSKTKPNEAIVEAYESGERNFGENKVQELAAKYEELPKDIKWHLIGHLQKNKVKYIVGKVELIHSLDNIKLLEELEKRYKLANEVANTLIQINIGNEDSKTGIDLKELEMLIEEVEKCQNVKVKGLMAIIPIGSDDECREYFKKMKNIFEALKNKKFKNINMEILSMGMSGDYKIAIEEGSTMVRVGQGIFGSRNYL